MEKSIIRLLKEVRGIVPETLPDLKTYSPLTLAFIGDAVYDLVIRSKVVLEANCPPHKLHTKTVRYVNARAQAQTADALVEQLSAEERAIYKRGCNAHPHTMPKHADTREYLKATGFEALIGYLFLADRWERLAQLLSYSMENKTGDETRG